MHLCLIKVLKGTDFKLLNGSAILEKNCEITTVPCQFILNRLMEHPSFINDL